MKPSIAALAVALAAATVPAVAQAGALFVLAPASVAGTFATGDATFGPQEFDLSGDLVLAEDPSDAAGPSSTDACSPLVNAAAVAGKIAVVDRGFCGFTAKIKNAQDAGAVGVVVANNMDGPPLGMGAVTGDPLAGAITIPSGTVTRALGLQLRAALVDGPVSVRLLRDVSAPTLATPGTTTVNATSPAGAVVAYAVTATDTLDPSPTVACSPASGASFPIGTTVVTCTATDDAGNTATATFDVVVKGAAQQIGDLKTSVESLNIQNGIANSLDAKLQAIQEALAASNAGDKPSACNKLNALINEVQAQSGKSISADDASRLVAAANRIKAVLGCGS